MNVMCKNLFVLVFFFGSVYSISFAQERAVLDDSSVVANRKLIERNIVNNAFKKGEFLKFDIRYGPIRAGHAYMEIPDIVQINGRSTFHVISRAESNKFFSSFYKVRDRVESFIDSVGIFPWRFEKHLREGKFSADVINLFDQANQLVITRKDTHQVPLFVQDVLSAMYFVRTQNIRLGEHLSVDNFSDGKNFPLEVKILKRENVRVKAGKFSCFVVEPILKSTGIFKQKGRLKVWMTEDQTHMPVMMKSEIVVGSIVAELIEYRGVNPVRQ
jgi:hypothetical protein